MEIGIKCTVKKTRQVQDLSSVRSSRLKVVKLDGVLAAERGRIVCKNKG